MGASLLDLNVSYQLGDFLDDQRRVMSLTGWRVAFSQDPVELVDGRIRKVYALLLRNALMEYDATKVFFEKYGYEPGECHVCRFSLVLDFLNNHHEELAESGLADEGEPIAILEDFLDYLLKYPIDSKSAKIPSYALIQFLDGWGHKR